jgi:hypothetical protein
MCQQVVSDKSENDVDYDVSFSSKVWNGKTFQKVYVSLQDPLACVKFIDRKELGHHIRESGLRKESTVVLLPSAGLIKALNNTVSVPVNTVIDCTKLLTSKTGVDDTQPSWLQSQKELLMSTPRGVGLQDFDTWSDWMLNGFVVLVRETEPKQIDSFFS